MLVIKFFNKNIKCQFYVLRIRLVFRLPVNIRETNLTMTCYCSYENVNREFVCMNTWFRVKSLLWQSQDCPPGWFSNHFFFLPNLLKHYHQEFWGVTNIVLKSFLHVYLLSLIWISFLNWHSTLIRADNSYYGDKNSDVDTFILCYQ